jgi:hypothetical protein
MERRFLFQYLCYFLNVKRQGLTVSKKVLLETQHPTTIPSADSPTATFSNATAPVFWAIIARRIERSCVAGPAIQA